MLALSTLLAFAPSLAFAQSPKAGVVTTLEGNVTARRVALPAPLPLKFKDDVFLHDTVATGDKSLARMLLGGKAVVTVRERSVLTITEVPGKSTIDLESGKFALAVAREKMRPGEEILIRTPNAIAGVRGTVVVTEVNRQSAQVGGGAPAVLTNFYVLRGTIVAQQLDPGTKQPMGAPLSVGTLQAYSQAGGAAPRVAPVPPEQVGQITSGLSPSGPKGGGEAGKDNVKAQAMQTAVALVSALTGGGPGGGDTQVALASAASGAVNSTSVATTPTTSTTAPIVPPVTSSLSADSVVTLLAELDEAIGLLTQLTGGLTLVSNGPYQTFSGTTVSTSTTPVLQFSDAVVIQTGGFDFISVPAGAAATIAGPLAVFSSSAVFTGGSFLGIAGSLTGTGTSPLISLDSTVLTAADALVALTGGTLTLAGPLVRDTSGLIIFTNELLRLTNATLKATGSDALVQLDGSVVSGAAALRMTSSSMSLAGPLLSVTNLGDSDTDTGGDTTPMFLLDGSTLTSSGTGALLTFTSSEATPDSNFLRLINGSTMSLAGPLLSGTGGTFGSGLDSDLAAFISVLDGSTLSSTTTSPLVSLSGATVDTQGPFISVRRSASTSARSTLKLAGPLLSATNVSFNTTSLGFASTFGSVQSCCSMFGVEQGAAVSSTTPSPLLGFTSSTVKASDAQSGGSIVFVGDTFTGASAAELVASSSLTLAGPLLSASDSTLTLLHALLSVTRSTASSTSTSPFITLTNSTVTAGGTDIASDLAVDGRLVTVLSAASPFGTAATPASLSLAGPLLSATASGFSGNDLIGVFGGATLSSTTLSPLVSLDGTSVKLSTVVSSTGTSRGDLLSVGGLGGASGAALATVTLSGPLLSLTNGATLTSTGGFLDAFSGGQVIESHPTSPFVSITGGTHAIASDTNGALFRLTGRSTSLTSETQNGITLSLGADQPLQRSGSGAYLETSGATITTRQGLRLDTALLAASAPLLSLKAASSLTSATDGLNLVANAKLTSTGPLVKIDASTLTVTSGHAVSVAGGSFLKVTGDMLSIANGGKLIISNGAALRVSGSSVVSISGALVNLSGSTSSVTINNTFTPSTACSTHCGGLAVSLQNGASVSNVSITSPVKNTGGTFSVASGGSAVVLDGPNAKLTISGQ